MGQMKELAFTITEVANGNKALEERMMDEVELHLNGLLPFGEMSMESQRAFELFEIGQKDEISYHQGHLGYPVDDDDLPLTEEEIK